MGFLDIDVSDAQVLKTFSTGSEVKLRVIDADVKTSDKTGGEYLTVSFEPIGEPGYKDITKVFMLPTSSDRPKQANNRKLAIKDYCEAFSISIDPQKEVGDYMIGAEGWTILREEEDAEWGMRNVIKKFILGH